MIQFHSSENMGRNRTGYIDSRFHFSFEPYYKSKKRDRFGVLASVNDILLFPGKALETHTHKNREIIAYIVEGTLSHEDSIGNIKTLKRGEVQYMGAGSGVEHKEKNAGKDVLREILIHIIPEKTEDEPIYEDYHVNCCAAKHDGWYHVAGSTKNDDGACIKIRQDANVYTTVIPKAGMDIEFDVKKGRQAYITVVEGKVKIKNYVLDMRDGIDVVEEKVKIHAVNGFSHILVIEMAKE